MAESCDWHSFSVLMIDMMDITFGQLANLFGKGQNGFDSFSKIRTCSGKVAVKSMLLLIFLIIHPAVWQ